jgi:thiol-disulfide isomerase/thioredoxin
MMIFFLFLVFVTVARFAYQTSFVKVDKNQKTANIANANNIKPITAVYFFHVDWCPHCVKAVPDWNAFVEIYNNKLSDNVQRSRYVPNTAKARNQMRLDIRVSLKQAIEFHKPKGA